MDRGSPYREGKPLATLIPPDRRKFKIAALVVVSMAVGGALLELGKRAVDPPPPASVTVPIVSVSEQLVPVFLKGPNKTGHIVPPAGEIAVLHVWVQGCQDCMPAFDAMHDLAPRGDGLGGQLGVPVFNVAFGEADESWAARYGVSTNLVFDPGGTRIVRPLGISSFTTLVVNRAGHVVHRDRPDRAGYVDRLAAAIALARHENGAPPDVAAGTVLTQADIERAVGNHRDVVRSVCWDVVGRDLSQANITLTVTIAPDGHVKSATTAGDAPPLQACIQKNALSWRFPPATQITTANVPFAFIRQ